MSHDPERTTGRLWAASGLPAAAVILFACAARARGDLPATLPNGVASGDVTQTSCVLWARSSAPGPVDFECATDVDFSAIIAAAIAAPVDATVPVKVMIEGLTPGTRYYYRATDSAGNRATGTFRTASSAGGRAGLRFGCSGDWRGDLAPYPAVSNAPGRELDFFVALGDTIYADIRSPAVPDGSARTLEQYRAKYAEVYGARHGAASLADLRASCAWFATIDDHEIVNDFAGGAPPASDPRFDPSGDFLNESELFASGIRAFQEYHPMREESYGDTGDGRTAGKVRLYRQRRFGDDAAIFVLDTRSFRDEPIAGISTLLTGAEGASSAFAAGRTMLGRAQVEELKAGLLAAEQEGVTWKVVFVPEPIQSLGPILAEDRFDGYAAERTEIMRHIEERGIRNVVFVAADIHCTIVNEVGYQEHALAPFVRLRAFEVVTGPVAFSAPFGPTVYNIARGLGALDPVFRWVYEQAPRETKDDMLIGLLNLALRGFRLDPIGLDCGTLNATLEQGRYYSLHTFGWTEFEIDAETQRLTVTTYGIDWYDADALVDPSALLARTPEVVSRFVVEADLPTGDPGGAAAACGMSPCGDGALFCLPLMALWVGRRRGRGQPGADSTRSPR